MSFSGIFARVVALIGAAALLWRRLQGAAHEPAWGSAPVVPAAKPQGAIPTLKMPTAQGLERRAEAGGGAGAQGQCVCDRPEASALDQRAAQWRRPRCRGDAGRRTDPGACSATRCKRRCDVPPPLARARTASRCCATPMATASPKRREIFMEGLNQPFGMALVGDTFYVGNTDGVVAFPYAAGADRITAPGRKLTTSSLAGIGRAACCRAPMAGSFMPASARSAISPRAAWKWRKAGPPSTSSIWLTAAAASLPAACATRWGWHGSRRPACSGRSSTSATASATRHLPTI